MSFNSFLGGGKKKKKKKKEVTSISLWRTIIKIRNCTKRGVSVVFVVVCVPHEREGKKVQEVREILLRYNSLFRNSFSYFLSDEWRIDSG